MGPCFLLICCTTLSSRILRKAPRRECTKLTRMPTHTSNITPTSHTHIHTHIVDICAARVRFQLWTFVDIVQFRLWTLGTCVDIWEACGHLGSVWTFGTCVDIWEACGHCAISVVDIRDVCGHLGSVWTFGTRVDILQFWLWKLGTCVDIWEACGHLGRV